MFSKVNFRPLGVEASRAKIQQRYLDVVDIRLVILIAIDRLSEYELTTSRRKNVDHVLILFVYCNGKVNARHY